MRNKLKKTQRNRNERNKQWKYTGERRMQTVSRTHSAGDTKYSRSAIKKDEKEIIKMQYCRWLMMDQCSSGKTTTKNGEIAFNRNRDKMALSDWEFPDVLRSLTSSLESLNLSSALAMSRFYFNHR